jgi:hypothetical protein
MANYRRSFNFRNGVQVDEDNFIVNANGLVGIGTSVPTEALDVHGNVVISGTLTAEDISLSSAEIDNAVFTSLNIGITSIKSGIISATSGVVTYYGDGGYLLNLPTSQWLDVDAGLGFTSIYSSGNVGVATNDPRFVFQVGGNNIVSGFLEGVGINNKGGILATGIVTARSFVGYGSDLTLLNASNITLGTLNNSILPSNINLSGIITAGTHFSGSLVGIASTAISITPTSNITVNSINSGFSTSGISTITNKLHVQGSVGVGTLNPNVDIHVRKNSISCIQITSDGSNPSRFIIGRNISTSINNAQLQFGNTDLAYQDSTETSFDISNYGLGNFNNYLHLGTSGINTGNFNWIYGQSLSKLMTLTYTGRLGLGITNPSNTLHVVGTSTVTGDSYIGGNLYLTGSFSPNSITVTNNAIFNARIGIQTSSPAYSFQIGREPFYPDGGIGISSRGDVYTAGVVTATRFAGDGSTLTSLNPSNLITGTIGNSINVNTSGVVTATRFAGDGSTLTALNPSNLTSGSIDGAININTSGIVTATRFAGDGSTLTALNPANLTTGTISNSININISGIVTATRFSGNGSTLTALDPANIATGTIGGDSGDAININTSGIVTSTNGFTSGTGGPVQIEVVGTNLRFIVPGVGSATLTLTP